ncbi:MAG: DUF192 domain-containing protein [Endomicrobium sp.]|uniref:DUF192 domain-containing protein n=1 Tax=Candidatus Endomicrobiellum pyrsonymphae TaxID=1408203 RepID=UPI003586D674|nr:DUF192 domain-containing protein [Endomicrobium sp.]
MSAFCCACASVSKRYNDGDVVYVNINGRTLKLVAATSEQAKVKGLSNRKEVSYDGMVFFFKQSRRLVFWMKDMHFPIDILWVANSKVIDISENVQPEPDVSDYNLKTYNSSEKTDTVIELNSGKAKQLNTKNGSIIKLQ